MKGVPSKDMDGSEVEKQKGTMNGMQILVVYPAIFVLGEFYLYLI